MTISYTPTIFSVQKSGGISRYFAEIINILSADKDLNIHLPVFFSANEYLDNRYIKQKLPGMISLQGTVQKIVNKQYWQAQLNSKKIDIIHPTYFDNEVLQYPQIPHVITIFDMIHEEMSDLIVHNDQTAENKRRLIETADKILTISYASKEKIIKFYPSISADKIVVTHLASRFQYQPQKKPVLPHKYILYVGARSGYKNFQTLLLAFQKLKQQQKFADLHLVMVGTQPFNAEEIKQIAATGLPQKIHFFHFSDSELESAYSHATCLVFPSKQEGFGLPLIEAMNCNCPIIASDIAVFKEVAGKAALYFDSNSSQELFEVLKDYLSSPKLSSELQEEASRQKQNFSWEKCAEITKQTYQSVLSE